MAKGDDVDANRPRFMSQGLRELRVVVRRR